ncbi:MAG: NADPH-dependent FMN reductase [Candidatus Paceibacterota bacterium]
MYIPVILGTAREGRQSEKVARFVRQEAVDFGLETEIIDVRDYRIEATNNTENSTPAKKLAEKIGKAEGFIIVSPEYNHGYPGELKMMLDMLYRAYARKPVAFCGVSIGGLGGARCVEQLRLVSVEFHMVPIREAVYFSNVANLFDANGGIQDPSYKERIKKMLNELSSYAKSLK